MSDSDDWATEDLPDLPVPSIYEQADATNQQQQLHDDNEGWERKLPPPKEPTASDQHTAVEEGEPMIIVDMTALSEADSSLPAIHSKFDANAVNDPEAVKKLRVTIETNYETYAKNANLLADGTVIPCGSTVWRPALARLRQARAGHYFCPIFPPKK